MFVRKNFLFEADAGGSGSAGGDGGDKGGTGNGTPAAPATKTNEVDLKTLSGDQLAQVLENKELWNLPRVKELREKAAQADKLIKAQSDAEEKTLTEQKKFEELAIKKGDELTKAQQQVQKLTIDNALTAALYKENVVDVDGALKLANRDKITITEDGSISGVEDTVNALKTDKSYLFNAGTGKPNNVGSPTNPNNANDQNGGNAKFKRSQITPSFYQANAKAINEAYAAGLVEDDGPAPAQ